MPIVEELDAVDAAHRRQLAARGRGAAQLVAAEQRESRGLAMELSTRPAARRAPLTPQELARLRALGYLR